MYLHNVLGHNPTDLLTRIFKKPDCLHARAARRFCDAGNLIEACYELEKISPENRAHPLILQIEYAVYAKVNRWDLAARAGEALLQKLPKYSLSWICYAYDLRRYTGADSSEIEKILQIGTIKSPCIWQFRYCLASYYAELGKPEHAEFHLKTAIQINKIQVERLVADDPGLKPVWDRLGKICPEGASP